MVEPTDNKILDSMTSKNQMMDADIEANPISDSTIKINFNYFLTLSGLLKQFQIILGFICIGIMINAYSRRNIDSIFQIFIICCIFVVLFTIGFHFACLLEWEPNGHLIMARIGYIYNRLSYIILSMISIACLVPMFAEIGRDGLNYFKYELNQWGLVVLAMILCLVNAFLYAESAKQVLHSISLY